MFVKSFRAGVSVLPLHLPFPFLLLSPPQSLRHRLQKTKEQAQHQEQLQKEQEGQLKALKEQLIR